MLLLLLMMMIVKTPPPPHGHLINLLSRVMPLAC
jgi:hypothetical protein